MLHRTSWNGGSFGEELKIGRCTVRLKRSLGEGGFAFVHLVEDVSNGRELVLKRASLQSKAGRAVYEKEASIMRSLAHPNIVQIVTAVEMPASHSGAILMEYCPGGHLLHILQKLGGKRMDEVAVLSIFCDVVSAVKYLHDKGICHRDLKLENVLRSASGPHKLCDFGSCVQGRVKIETAEQRANEEEVVEKTTTQMYRAPEMVDLYMERELTEKVDVWALGCILFAVCYLKHPFQDAGNLGILSARVRTPEDSGFSPGVKELTQRMLMASPTYRPSVSEVEVCAHDLSRGNPLPPPRTPRPPEPKDGLGPSRNSTAAIAVDATGSVQDGRGGVDDHRREAAGRRSSSSAGAKTAIKAKEPQLNPNSVAARRLASRKEEQGIESKQPAAPGSANHGSLSRPSPARDRTVARGDNSSKGSADHNREYEELCRRARRQPPGVVRPPPAPGPGLKDPVPQRSASAPRDTSPLGHGTGTTSEVAPREAGPGAAGGEEGWSGFANFDQFSADAGVPPAFSDGFEAASFDASAASGASDDPFAAAPNGGDVDSSGSGRGTQRAVQRGRNSSVCDFNAERSGTRLERRHSIDQAVLVDLGSRNDFADGGQASVAVLGQRFARTFSPSSAPGGVNSSFPAGVCGWTGNDGAHPSRPWPSSQSAGISGQGGVVQPAGVPFAREQQGGVQTGGGASGGQRMQGVISGSGGSNQPWLAAQTGHHAAVPSPAGITMQDLRSRQGFGAANSAATAGSWHATGRGSQATYGQLPGGQHSSRPLPPRPGGIPTDDGKSGSPLRVKSGSPGSNVPHSDIPSPPQCFVKSSFPQQDQQQHQHQNQQGWTPPGAANGTGGAGWTGRTSTGTPRPISWSGGVVAQPQAQQNLPGGFSMSVAPTPRPGAQDFMNSGTSGHWHNNGDRHAVPTVSNGGDLKHQSHVLQQQQQQPSQRQQQHDPFGAPASQPPGGGTSWKS